MFTIGQNLLLSSANPIVHCYSLALLSRYSECSELTCYWDYWLIVVLHFSMAWWSFVFKSLFFFISYFLSLFAQSCEARWRRTQPFRLQPLWQFLNGPGWIKKKNTVPLHMFCIHSSSSSVEFYFLLIGCTREVCSISWSAYYPKTGSQVQELAENKNKSILHLVKCPPWVVFPIAWSTKHSHNLQPAPWVLPCRTLSGDFCLFFSFMNQSHLGPW